MANRKPMLGAAAIFFCAGLSIAFFLVKAGLEDFAARESFWAGDFVLVSPVVFVCGACILIFYNNRPAFGYLIGGIACVLALPWFVLLESSVLPSIWMSLNRPRDWDANWAVVEILIVGLIVAAGACVVLRLIPSAYLRQRIWPAIAAGVLVLAGWLIHSGRPWMIPEAVDAFPADLRVLHVVKRGLQFHETTVIISRSRNVTIRRNDRRLFQYRFQSRVTDATLPPGVEEQVNQVVHSAELRRLSTAPPVPLRSWNAEGWYVALNGPALMAFTSEYGTSAPGEIREVFERIEKVEGPQQFVTMADVCLGFCYDPVSGLGFWYSNQRCRVADRKIECR